MPIIETSIGADEEYLNDEETLSDTISSCANGQEEQIEEDDLMVELEDEESDDDSVISENDNSNTLENENDILAPSTISSAIYTPASTSKIDFSDDIKAIYDNNPIKLKSPIRSSHFSNGDAVLYFPKADEQLLPISKGLQKQLRWKVNKGSPSVVRAVLRAAQMKLVRSGDDWIGYWGKHWVSEKFKTVHPWQKVNHFPMAFEVGRKDKMYMNHQIMRQRVGEQDVSYLPQTFILPRQRRHLKRVFGNHPLWIIKPPASARGIGIRVISSWSELPRKRDLICSQYIYNPLLINNRKFDLRLYVAVTSFDPMRCYLHSEGIVRFASDPYRFSLNSKQVKNRFMHLTNYSITKKKLAKKDSATEDTVPKHNQEALFDKPEFSMSDSKWSLEVLKKYMAIKGLDYDGAMGKIEELIIKTMMSVHQQNSAGVRMSTTNKSSCYEMFGFDVLLDENLKPWLMEVNISPAMKATCDTDLVTKKNVITDLFNLIGIRIKDLELAKQAATSKTPIAWKRPFLSSTERSKQRDIMIGKIDSCLKDLTDDDLKVLADVEDENSRKGNFKRLYPSFQYEGMHKFFASFNYYDRLVHKWTSSFEFDEDRIAGLKQAIKMPSSFASKIINSKSQGDVSSKQKANERMKASRVPIDPFEASFRDMLMKREFRTPAAKHQTRSSSCLAIHSEAPTARNSLVRKSYPLRKSNIEESSSAKPIQAATPIQEPKYERLLTPTISHLSILSNLDATLCNTSRMTSKNATPTYSFRQGDSFLQLNTPKKTANYSIKDLNPYIETKVKSINPIAPFRRISPQLKHAATYFGKNNSYLSKTNK